MAKPVLEFDRGVLALWDVKFELARCVRDFAQELRQTWDYQAVSSNVEVWGLGYAIELYVELTIDSERYVIWSFDIDHQDGSWELDRRVELNAFAGGTIEDLADFETQCFDGFEEALDKALVMLAELFATRADVERRLTQQKD